MLYFASIAITFFITFALQSLTILLFKHSTFMRIVPLGMFLVPFPEITSVIIGIPELISPELLAPPLIPRLVILLSILIGDILGWVMGFYFRKIIDKEHKEMIAKYAEESERDNNQTD